MRLLARPLWLLLPLLVLSLAISLGYAQRALDGWDSMAYIYAGQQLADGQGLATMDPNNISIGPYFGLSGYRLQREPGPHLYLTFPPGFPLILALAQVWTGVPQAAFAVVPLLAVLTAAGTSALAGDLFDAWVGWAAVALLVFTPTFLTFSTAPWSDVPAAALIVLAAALFVRAQRARSARQGAVLGAIAGLCVGYSGFIRTVGVLAGPALLAYGWYRQRRQIAYPANLAFALLWGLGTLGLLIFNRVYYGGFLATGYNFEHSGYSWPFFSLSYALGPSPADGRSLIAAAQTLARDFSLLLIPAALGLWTMPRQAAVLLVGLGGALLAPHVVYAFAPTGINARFLLSIYPWLALAAAYGLGWIAGHLAPGYRDAALLVIAIFGVLVVLQPWTTLERLAERNRNYEKMAASVQELTAGAPPDAVFLAYNLGDPIFFYGGRSVLYYRHMSRPERPDGSSRPVEERLTEAVDRLLARGTPVYFVDDTRPPLWNVPDMLRRHYRLSLYRADPPTYRVERPDGGGGAAAPYHARHEREQSVLLRSNT
jgi:hypothetical protein